MGTSESTLDAQGQEGLIPRFVYDLFENIDSSVDAERVAQFKISVSFLEIYGEDVFDLIPCEGRSTAERPSLMVRENEGGNVVVQGLQQVKVDTAEQAVEYLMHGMKNRITAATLMNAGSSRSHAVYVITLEQTNGGEDDGHTITSKLTFVDLAGSERIGRTHAEGKLKKEGIQINSGLFCLGQVINGLADDQRLKSGVKQTHIPYRNSKLTHLLKDALGGNSQTLFLACVSPADSNESETYSTLTYAKAARNIKNKPIRNMDKTQLEIIRLRYAVKAWTLKAVAHLVQDASAASTGNSRMSIALPDLSPVHPSKRSNAEELDAIQEILERPDVQEYIRNVNKAIEAKLEVGASATPRKVRLSIGVANQGGRQASSRAHPSVRSLISNFEAMDTEQGLPKRGCGLGAPIAPRREMTLPAEMPNPEDSEKLVARMQEMVAQEKELLERESEGEQELQEVDRAIGEKEEILSKLMDTVKGFSTMKVEYEKVH